MVGASTMINRAKFESHEQYIAAAHESVRPILLKIQAVVDSKIPNAVRCISYSMPAYNFGKVFFYFAAFKNHIGIYPPVKEDAALIQELAAYRNAKGNLSFPFSRPMPYELIGRVAMSLAKEYSRK
jgi:uncharacterized protein YdhG (YjbR/CyaY superfamily)